MPLLNIAGLPTAALRRQYLRNVTRTHAQSMMTSATLRSPSEHRVVLDNQTLYIDQTLAEALGWKPEQGSDAGVQLSLSGWGPTYFAIAPTGSDSDRLARAVVQSSHNPKVKQVLDYLKER
ncbi:hypothetical protein M0805_009825 [Coniferiporia weirii]|nr:hypothetical protein M0805_009825 [Coniferiporia weirii]